MNEAQYALIDIQHLQIGMFIELELGWMSHPFPKGSFKISSKKQIEIIQGLGLKQVRVIASKSETDLVDAVNDEFIEAAQPMLDSAQSEAFRFQKYKSDLLALQKQGLAACERRFGETVRQYKLLTAQAHSNPRVAMNQCMEVVNTFVGEMIVDGESAIRLLSEGMGDRASMHPVNVTIISLLLGKSLGLSSAEMLDLGMAAMLHDIGKTRLPDRVRWVDDNFSSAEYKLYQEHVEYGVVMGQRMELAPGALLAIAQHHELVDGSGFPGSLKGDHLSQPAKILALVNRYENLCNPGRPTAAITPHEALSLIFAQFKTRFDSVTLNAFIRMMGVYPPGSVVQLVDGRFALVVSVNSSRPLKPCVIVHEPGIAKDDALLLDLERAPDLGIRRSVKPSSLPKATLDYLSPRQRICYFFERATDFPLEGINP